MNKPPILKRLRGNLLRATSGVAMTEFALALPMVLTAGLWGAEVANQAITQMRISQAAIQLADNGSRIGEGSALQARRIYESDINDIITGVNIHAGSLGILQTGRVIISSLEVVPGTVDQQYIHWQRCAGGKVFTSSYGVAGDGLGGGFFGMGPEGEEIQSLPGEAVIFVEVVYDYQPLVDNMFTYVDTMQATAAFFVRADRDLSGIYQRDDTAPDPVADCATYRAVGPVGAALPEGGTTSTSTSSGSASSGGSGGNPGGGGGGPSDGISTSGGGSGSSSSSSSTTTSGGGSSSGGSSSGAGGSSGGGGGGGQQSSPTMIDQIIDLIFGFF